MKKLAFCALLAVLIALACCPCKQVPSKYQRQPKKRQFSHGYVPTSLDSLLLFNAWDGRSCLALDSFFQLWENQSRMAIAQEAPPDDTIKVVYELFEILFSQVTDTTTGKYIAIQDSVTVAVVDSTSFDAIRSLAAESFDGFQKKYGRSHAFRGPIEIGKPTLCGFQEFHKAINFFFLEDDLNRLCNFDSLEWASLYAKSKLLEPYLRAHTSHWGIAILTYATRTMPSVILNDKLSRAIVEYRDWASGGRAEFSYTGTQWVQTREIITWIE